MVTTEHRERYGRQNLGDANWGKLVDIEEARTTSGIHQKVIEVYIGTENHHFKMYLWELISWLYSKSSSDEMRMFLESISLNSGDMFSGVAKQVLLEKKQFVVKNRVATPYGLTDDVSLYEKKDDDVSPFV